MRTVRHKFFGTAQIIRREGDRITIKYDKNGKEVEIKFPEAFTVSNSLLEPDAELQREVDAAIEAKKKSDRVVREEREAARAQAHVDQSAHRSGTRRSGRTFTQVQLTGDYEKDFETFMLKNQYRAKTEKNTKSTIYSYVNSVKSVMSDEGLGWTSLVEHISSVASVYDIGGVKEGIGAKGNRTVINALRRFEDFVNHSTP